MAVFFALMVVAVIAGAAVVAVRWPTAGQLPEPTTDQMPTLVPEAQLTAAHLAAVRFPVVVRGYRMEDVDALLGRLSDQLQHQEPIDEAPQA